LIYEEPGGAPKFYLENWIRDVVPYTELATRKTGTAIEVEMLSNIWLSSQLDWIFPPADLRYLTHDHPL